MVETKVYRIGGDSLIQSPDLWAFIKSGLLAVKHKVGDRSDWQPLHVRRSIEANGSELWVVYEESQPVGFYVLSVVNSPFTGIPQALWAWITYATPGHWGLIEAHLPDVRIRAEQLGIEWIEFMSPRLAWGRRMEKLGFQCAEVIWRMKV